jgi:hypothetical protein
MEKLTRDLPRIIGTEAVKSVKQNFQKQGYDSGSGVTPWKPRKASTNMAYDRGRVDIRGRRRNTGRNSTYRGSTYSSANPLLQQTRSLLRSIKYQVIGKRVNIGTDLTLIPYAKAMNKTRKFMPSDGEGPNVLMLSRIKQKIEFERGKIMREFRR